MPKGPAGTGCRLSPKQLDQLATALKESTATTRINGSKRNSFAETDYARLYGRTPTRLRGHLILVGSVCPYREPAGSLINLWVAGVRIAVTCPMVGGR